MSSDRSCLAVFLGITRPAAGTGWDSIGDGDQEVRLDPQPAVEHGREGGRELDGCHGDSLTEGAVGEVDGRPGCAPGVDRDAGGLTCDIDTRQFPDAQPLPRPIQDLGGLGGRPAETLGDLGHGHVAGVGDDVLERDAAHPLVVGVAHPIRAEMDGRAVDDRGRGR